VAAVKDDAEVLRFSQTAFPGIIPPEERILVTTVASILGVQPVNVEVPTRQGTLATQILSLMQIVLCFRRSDVGDLWAR
jgi:hypothetical protein